MGKQKLPQGKTCNDCFHIKRCYFLFGCSPSETRCDFMPSKFLETTDPLVASYPYPYVQADQTPKIDAEANSVGEANAEGTCPDCDGSGEVACEGWFNSDGMTTCERCNGKGKI